MDTIQLNKIYTLDHSNTIEVIKKTKHFITYRCGKLKRVQDENGVYTRNYIYYIYGEENYRNYKTKLFVEDEGNNIYIKGDISPDYFKTDKHITTFYIFDDNKIIERKII